MSSQAPKNLPASVHAKLLAIAKQRTVNYEHILQQYVNERILYRLSKTRYSNDFVLKGGTLFGLLFGQPNRPTKDIDFLSFGDNEPETLRTSFLSILAVNEDDGIVFDLGTLNADKIKEDEQYEGVRLTCNATFQKSRILVQIDIGFGDAILTQEKMKLRTLLDFPQPELFVYPPESVISEKFEAMVKLGLFNSRMKDFYDIYGYSQEADFQADKICEALKQTFLRRATPIPIVVPLALTSEFFENKEKVTQWKAFKKRVKAAENLDLKSVCEQIEQFLMPAVTMLAPNAKVEGYWSRQTGWN